MNKFLFFLFAFISFFLHTNAKNIYVNDNSTTNGDIYTTAVGSSTNSGLTPGSPLLTLGSAIGIAVANDVIYVDAGTYPGSTNNTLSIPTTLSGIQIIGAHISKTIFNGGITGIKNFLTILAKDITIKNMTISNYGYGGAVNVIASDAVVNSKVYFENVYFYRNLKSVAFNVSPSSHINGGALSIEVSGANKPAEVHVTNCQFDHNTSEDNLGGGAIYVSEKSNLILDRSRITCNNKGELQTTEDGGGILFDDSEGTITNSFFSGNIAQDRSGGAIQTINATTTKTLTISESIFTKNEAKNGAAISIEDRYLVNITNSLFYDNLQRTSSFQDGGTIDIHAGGTATINLVNSTVAYNRSTGGGTDAAGLANSTSGVFNVKNSIIWGNASKNINSANIITTYCIIENVGNSSPANATNSFLNPQFTSTVTPDYSLLPASPAINFGTLTGAPLNDIANNSRVGNPDAGCFEALSTNPISNISSCDALFCASTPSISVTASSNVSCNGGANGSATITPSGGSGSYTITWSPGNLTGAIQNSLTAQIYTITVDDGGACIGTKTLSITQPSTFTVGLTANSNTICTTNSLVLTPVGALTYTLNPGNLTGNSFTLSPASTTIYSLTGTSALGCLSSNTASTEVTVNTTPTAAITPPSTLTCSSKTITLTGSGGGGYSWSGPGIVTGSSTATPSVNVAGVYNLTVTSSGCSNSTSVAVIANTITPLVSTTTNTLTCSITTVNISVTTTTTPVDYLWSGSGILSANNTSTINVNQSGNFNYTVTNTTNGCLANGNVIVSQNITPPSASASGGTLTCITTSLSLTGGPLSGVTYSWSGPGINGSSTSSSATAIASGSYTLITTSAINGCSNTAVTTVSSNTTVPQISIGSDLTINCLTATVTLNGSSSSPGVNYSWTGPAVGIPAGATPTSSTSIVSASGIYTLTITDPLNGCSNSAFESVSTNTILPDIALSSSSQTITCSTPTITLSGSSLTSGVTYSWNPGGSSPSNSVTTINTNGTYSLTVTNTLSGCISTSVVTITSNTVLPTLTLTPTSYTTTCSNPTTTLIAESDADPDVNYSWTVPSTGSINNTNISNPIASGSGAFTVQATNTLSGCMSPIAIANIIADINVPVLNVTATNSTICSGSTSTLSITGADTYSWSTTETGSSITVSPTVTTTYSVVGTNTLTGCSNVINTTVNVNITPTVSVLSISNQTICSGNTATIIPTGANTYTLISNIDTYTNDPFIVNPTTTTTYTLNGESAEGCLSGNTETVTITVNATPTVAILAVSNSTFCSGNNSVITPTALPIGAVSYTLEPGTLTGISFTVSPISTTTYTLSGISAEGCLSANTETTTLTVNPTPTVSILSVSNASICSGNNTEITPNGASTYTLEPGTQSGASFTVSPATTTSYTITGTSTEGCLAGNTATIEITVHPTPTISILSVSNTSICLGNNSIISPIGASTFTLEPGSITGTTFTVNPTTTTTYTITGTSAEGCLAANNATTEITVNLTPTVIASANPGITCTTGTVNLIASTTATSYTWTLGNGVDNTNQNNQTVTFPANGLTTGTYTYSVTVTSTEGCVSMEATTTLTVIDVPNANFDLSDLSICQNQIGTISINNPQTGAIYDWNINGQTVSNTNPLIIPTSATGVSGTQTISVVASVGSCSNTAVSTLTINVLPDIALVNPVISSCENTIAQLDVSGPIIGNTYIWTYNGQIVSTGASLSLNLLTKENSGSYTVTTTDVNGCTNSTVGVVNLQICDIYVPEIFTPNGDGKNDDFVIKNIENYPNNNLKIFNRWGNKVYEKDKYQNEFSGYANTGDAAGKEKLPAGTYYVILDYGDGKKETYNGYLLLQY